MAQEGALAALIAQRKKLTEAQDASKAPATPKPAPKAASPVVEGMKKAAPPAPYVPIKEKSAEEKEESRRMAEAEMRMRERKRAQ